MVKHMINEQTELCPCSHEECMELLAALTDDTRQRIIVLFYKNKELCVTDIAGNFDLSRPTISHHLNLMKRAKLLNTRKEGKEIYYSFNRDYVIDMMESILDSLKQCCC
jgi:ArsR family transcriptional regulator, arsenate/arsenite/antimonite-responsive transcriptional repressor